MLKIMGVVNGFACPTKITWVTWGYPITPCPNQQAHWQCIKSLGHWQLEQLRTQKNQHSIRKCLHLKAITVVCH